MKKEVNYADRSCHVKKKDSREARITLDLNYNASS